MGTASIYQVSIDGSDVTLRLQPLLISLDVQLQAGGQGDTAALTFDDTGGQIVMPRKGAKISVALGWQGGSLQIVFDGTVDEVRSAGSRGGGRTLAVSAKGFEAEGPIKDAQRRHWDDATVQTILGDAAKSAGLAGVKVDPQLAGEVISYWAMVDESFLHMGQRLAQRIGGHFRIQGDTAVMARRGAAYLPKVEATYGENLHGWDVAPVLGRAIYGKVVARYYDKRAARWETVEVETGHDAAAVYTVTPPATDEKDAKRQAKAKAEAIKDEAGAGSVTIEGNPSAVPDGTCVLRGARAGIDGAYRIRSVSHSVGRSGGFVTVIEVAHPGQKEGGASG